MKFARAYLIKKLQENKEKHQKDFQETHSDYILKVIEVLEKALFKARDNKEVGNFGMLQLPPIVKDHTVDYDRVLSMLEATTDEEVNLSQTYFSQYVQDNWDWKEDYNRSKTSLYSM